jgi:hypothetical protein
MLKISISHWWMKLKISGFSCKISGFSCKIFGLSCVTLCWSIWFLIITLCWNS